MKSLLSFVAFLVMSCPTAVARGAASAEFETTCFFNGAGEPCLVDHRDGVLHVIYLRDGKKVIYTEINPAASGSVAATVIDGTNSYAAEGLWLVRGWNSPDGRPTPGPAYQYKTRNGTTIIPMYVYSSK